MVRRMDLIDYLRTHFLTAPQLLQCGGIDAHALGALQQRRVMPLPSYRLAIDARCVSFFGVHDEQLATDYYPTGSPAWLASLGSLTTGEQARQHFARRYCARLASLPGAGLPAIADRLMSDAHIDSEWQHFLAGTYGVCTRSGSPEDIAAKEAAIVTIRHITADGGQVDAARRDQLRAAVDLLDAVSAPFAPHEVARSSRHRYVDQVRAAFEL